jgi:hypothetical protein
MINKVMLETTTRSRFQKLTFPGTVLLKTMPWKMQNELAFLGGSTFLFSNRFHVPVAPCTKTD